MRYNNRRKVKFIVETTGTGFSAYAKDYPVYTTGGTLVQLEKNMLDAINSWFEHEKIPQALQEDITYSFASNIKE